MEVTVKSDLVHITADNGKKVVVDLHTGDLVQPMAKPRGPRSSLFDQNGLRNHSAKREEIRVSPRVTLRLGDEVEAQLKKGGRKFRSKIRELREEQGKSYVGVTDPRTGSSRLISTDLVTKPRKKLLASR